MAIIRNLKHLKGSSDRYYFGLPVNATDTNPLYLDIVEKTYRELTKLIARYTRTVLIRLDLVPGNVNPYHIDLTKFCRSFKRKLETKYKSEVVYQWVREHGRNDYNDGFHWHLWVGVKSHDDFQPDTQSRHMQDLIIEAWKLRAGKTARNQKTSWFYIQRQYLSLDNRLKEQKLISEGGRDVLVNMSKLLTRRNNKSVALGGVIDECFYALSYLAKVYTKVRTPGSKDLKIFSGTNITTKKMSVHREAEVEKQLDLIHEQLSQPITPIPITTERLIKYPKRKYVPKAD